jgi:hypothetical protein
MHAVGIPDPRTQRKEAKMKRALATTLLAGALLVPAAVLAQDESPAASMAPTGESPAASMAPLGVTTFDVCLAITGPVIELTPEALTQGIADGTFVIEGMSDACETGVASPMASSAPDTSMAPEEPMASPMASMAAEG